MNQDGQDRALEAFRRLLAEAQGGGQAKVDALVALSQRTVFVATWEEGGEELRTLVNANKEIALPVFTALDELQKAAGRFGWQGGGRGCPHKELGARATFTYALEHKVDYVVVDIASSHALDIVFTELEPLLSTSSRSDSTGPFAAVGRISSSMLEAVQGRPSEETPAQRAHEDVHAAPPPPPPMAEGVKKPRGDHTVSYLEPVGQKRGAAVAVGTGPTFGRAPGPQQPASPPTATYGMPPAEPSTAPYEVGASPPAPAPEPPPVPEPAAPRDSPSQSPLEAAAATFADSMPPQPAAAPTPREPAPTPTGERRRPSYPTPDAGSRVTIWKVTEPPPDTLLDALTAFLRDYPEIEWAAYCMVSRGTSGAVPTIGLRVDASFRERLDEIVVGIESTGASQGATLTILVLDDPNQVKHARTDGIAFYPWRR